MKIFSRPAFYVICLLIVVMLLLTTWMSWKLEGLPKRKGKAKQETAPAAVSHPP